MYKKIFLLLSVMSFAMQTDFLIAAYKGTPPPLPRRPGEQPPPLPPRRGAPSQLPWITEEAKQYFLNEVSTNWKDVDNLEAVLKNFNTNARAIYTITPEVEKTVADVQARINELKRPKTPPLSPRRPPSPPPVVPAGDVNAAMTEALNAAKKVVMTANAAGEAEIAAVWQAALDQARF